MEAVRMNFTKKQIGCFVLCLTLVFACSVAFANPMVNIVNLSGVPLHIYDTGSANWQAIVLQDGKTLSNHQLATATVRRIWFVSEDVAAGTQPSPFGDAAFSFVEYTVNDQGLTIDNSYVDYFSYPVTLKFNTDCNGKCVKDFEYGFKSLDKVVNALKNVSTPAAPWDKLVYKDYGSKKINRVFAPSFVWSSVKSTLPTDLLTFYNAFPPEGTQLFAPKQNNDVWQNYGVVDGKGVPVESRLLTVGFSKALLSSAAIDTKNRHGFYIFPNDNPLGEFTNISGSITTTITVYPNTLETRHK
jgi:hypothetical protein